MDSVIDRMKAGGKDAQKILLGFLTLVCITITVASLIFFYKDVETSYRGWGVKVLELIDSGENNTLFALSLSILSTLIQIAWYMGKKTGVKFIKDDKTFFVLMVAATIFDCALDINAQYVPEKGASSFVMAVVITLLVYTVLSEMLFSFFAPVSFALLKSFIEGTDWGFNDGGGRSMPSRMPGPAMPPSAARKR